MSGDRGSYDHRIVEKLRKDAQDLATLEQQLKRLEQERDHLRNSTSELSQQLDELTAVRDEWEWFFENSLEMLCIAGVDGYFKRVNPAFARTLGYSVEELLSRPFVDLVHPDDAENTRKELDDLVHGIDSVSFENRYRDAEGNWRWILWHCPAKAENYDRLYAIARDITIHKRREQDILYKASHDSLTSLHNRAAFEERLEEAIRRCRRNAEQQVALYLLDLDGFKEVNDSYGHPAGDRVLMEIGRRFRKIKRSDELVCRLGGDEFAFLLEGITRFDLEPLAWRIVKAVQEPIDLGDMVVNVDCSIGIATFPEPASDPGELIAQADQAMYRVKQDCCGGFHVVGHSEPVLYPRNP